jgi:hypothetical protein
MISAIDMDNPFPSLFIIIILLAVYIIYLHIQLTRKNIFIESIVKRLTGIEKEWNSVEMNKFLSELHRLSLRGTFSKDKIFEDKTLNFILDNERDTKIYIHYTKDENDAKSILRQGFKFVDSFHKTALPISNDKLDLMIKHNSRKYFGDFIIIISISNDIVKHYSAELEKTEIKNYYFENVLTETTPVKNDNSDLEYLLPLQYIKGYINHRTGQIISNPSFNPGYSSPLFKANIDRIKEGSRHT